MSHHTARVATAARRQLDMLSGLTTTEALEVLGATSGLLLSRLQPACRPAAIAILRVQTTAALDSGVRHHQAVAAA